MKCSGVRDILMAYAAGELASRDAEEVRAHLDGCESCRAEAGIAGKASAELGHLREEELAPELIGAVRRKLEVVPPRLRLARLAAAFCATILIAVLAACWLWQKPAPTVRQDTIARRETARVVSNPVTHQRKAASVAPMRTKPHRVRHHSHVAMPRKKNTPRTDTPLLATDSPDTTEGPPTSAAAMILTVRRTAPQMVVIHVPVDPEAANVERPPLEVTVRPLHNQQPMPLIGG